MIWMFYAIWTFAANHHEALSNANDLASFNLFDNNNSPDRLWLIYDV